MDELEKTTEPTVANTTEEVSDAEESEATKKIREAAENMAQKIRDQALIRGARMTASVVLQTINKHLHKNSDISRRDLERCLKEISTFTTGLLKQTEENDEKEENPSDDGRPEESN